MPELRWRKRDGAILPSGSWKPGKEVVLGSDDFIEPPGHFMVYRMPGTVVRRFRERQGKPALIELDRLKAYDEGERSRSEAWTLPTPGRIKSRLVFEDDQLHRSSAINVSRLGTLRPTIGPKIPIPHVPGASVTLGIQVEITMAVDPVVELSVMTPWGEGDEDLGGLLEELAAESTDEGEDPGATVDEFLAYLAPHLPAKAPQEWGFSIPAGPLELAEGERVEVLVELRAPTRGSTAFALQMRALDGPSDLVSTSDLLVIEVPEDPSRAAFLFGDDDGRGELRMQGNWAEQASRIAAGAQTLELSELPQVKF